MTKRFGLASLLAALCALCLAGSARAAETTIFGSDVPANPSQDAGTQAMQSGVRFSSSVNGRIVGLRFYKSEANTGKHTGALWTRRGRQLASLTFTGESTSGWQTARFSSPITISANTTYVATSHTNVGHYAGDEGYFSNGPKTSGPLTATGSRYAYGSDAVFPTQTYNGTNYYVDVVFDDGTTPTPTPAPSPSSTPTPEPSPTPTPTPRPQPSARFTVGEGGRIYDPDGHLFVPVGANVNGPFAFWSESTTGASAGMAPWHFNTIRLITRTRCGTDACWHQDDDLDKLIAEYTSKKYVVMIAPFDYAPGAVLTDTEMAEFKAWLASIAEKYKDNPYVWFETLNEPTGHPSSDSDTQSVEGWFTLQKELGDVIHEKAPNSVIVFDGTSLGQDKGTWACTHAPSFGNPPDWWQQLSGGLVHGQDLQARYGRDNVVISPHFYGQWAGNKDYGCGGPADDPYQYWREDMQTYLNKLSTAGVPVVVGEWGAPDRLADEDWAMGGSWDAAHIFMEQVAPNQAVKPGSLNWACSAGDAYPLMNPDGYCLHWSGDMSVLTWQGRDLDDYARLVNP